METLNLTVCATNRMGTRSLQLLKQQGAGQKIRTCPQKQN